MSIQGREISEWKTLTGAEVFCFGCQLARVSKEIVGLREKL